MLRAADESSSADELEVGTFEQPNAATGTAMATAGSSSDVAEHKQVATAKSSSGVVGRILELKKRRQQLTGRFVTCLLI